MTMVNDWSVRDWTRKSIEEVIYQYYKHKGPKTYNIIPNFEFNGIGMSMGTFTQWQVNRLVYSEGVWTWAPGENPHIAVDTERSLFEGWIPFALFPNFTLDVGGGSVLSSADIVINSDYVRTVPNKTVTVVHRNTQVQITGTMIYVNPSIVSVNANSYYFNNSDIPYEDRQFTKPFRKTDGIIRFNTPEGVTDGLSKFTINAVSKVGYETIGGNLTKVIQQYHSEMSIDKITEDVFMVFPYSDRNLPRLTMQWKEYSSTYTNEDWIGGLAETNYYPGYGGTEPTAAVTGAAGYTPVFDTMGFYSSYKGTEIVADDFHIYTRNVFSFQPGDCCPPLLMGYGERTNVHCVVDWNRSS